MSSSRFLYLIGQLGPGGSERQLWCLLQALDRERYPAAVAVWNAAPIDAYGARLRQLNLPLYSFATLPSSSAKLAACGRLVRTLQPEVVHSYSFFTNLAAYLSTRGTKSVPMGSVRGDFAAARKDTGGWLGAASARWPRSQIFNSASAAADCKRSPGPFVPRQVAVVHNGIDLTQFPRLAPVPGVPRMLGVGSLVPVKRWDRLCRVAAELKSRGVDVDVEIAGSGPQLPVLEQQARDLRVDDRVRFIGHVGEILPRLLGARCLVHPSDSEGCPNAVLEAMACGRPVVATGVGDIPAIVEDGTTGFVVRPGDDAALVERLHTLLIDDALCRRMGAAGRARVERQFGVDRLVSETLAAYRGAGWRGC